MSPSSVTAPSRASAGSCVVVIGGIAPTHTPHHAKQTVAALRLRLVPLDGERALEHVALTANTHQTTVRLDDGKMTDMTPVHQFHGRLERVLRVSCHHLGRHEIPDSQLPYFTARSSDCTRDIALGEHPRQPPGLAQHRQQTDVVLRHQPGRRLDPRLGPGGDQKITLAFEQVPHPHVAPPGVVTCSGIRRTPRRAAPATRILPSYGMTI